MSKKNQGFIKELEKNIKVCQKKIKKFESQIKEQKDFILNWTKVLEEESKK